MLKKIEFIDWIKHIVTKEEYRLVKNNILEIPLVENFHLKKLSEKPLYNKCKLRGVCKGKTSYKDYFFTKKENKETFGNIHYTFKRVCIGSISIGLLLTTLNTVTYKLDSYGYFHLKRIHICIQSNCKNLFVIVIQIKK